MVGVHYQNGAISNLLKTMPESHYSTASKACCYWTSKIVSEESYYIFIKDYKDKQLFPPLK